MPRSISLLIKSYLFKMLHNIVDIGLLSIGTIVNLSVSFSRFSAVVSIFGVLTSAAVSLLSCKSLSGTDNLGGVWFRWLSNLCNLCISAAGLSHFLDYFDGNKAQDYIHFMPTTTMPHLMPITVIVVLSVLFALGLEESRLLNILLSVFFLLTFVIFCVTSLGNVNYNIKLPEFQEDFMSLLLPCTMIFLPCYVENNTSKQDSSKATTLNCGIYAIVIMTLAGMSFIKCELYGLLCPLNKRVSWYEPVELMLISCTLALAAYSLYVPTLKTLLRYHGRYFELICKENKVTGTYVNAVITIGSICSLLMYLFSSYQLLMIGSSAFVIGNALNTILSLNNNYQPEYIPKLRGTIVDFSNHYEQVNCTEALEDTQVNPETVENDEETFSDDSGHSSETDIDAEVADYREKVKILSSFREDKQVPTLQTGYLVSILLIFIALLSYLASQALQNNQIITAVLLVLGIICWSFIIFHQPSRTISEEEENKSKFLFAISSFVCNVILLGSVNSQIWFILLFWIILGCLLWLQNKYYNIHQMLFQKSKNKVMYFFKEEQPPLISTECYVVQSTLNLNQETTIQGINPY